MGRILLIDDVDDFRSVTAAQLQAAGHEVVEARNGRDGVEQLRRCQPDLVITDVLMPEADGVTVLKEIAERDQPIPVLAVSGGGAAMPASVSLLLASMFGAHRTLFKPFRRHELVDAVDDLLQKA